MTLKQTEFTINDDGSSTLYIDGVKHGVYSKEETPIVKGLLNTLHARGADISVLTIVE